VGYLEIMDFGSLNYIIGRKDEPMLTNIPSTIVGFSSNLLSRKAETVISRRNKICALGSTPSINLVPISSFVHGDLNLGRPTGTCIARSWKLFTLRIRENTFYDVVTESFFDACQLPNQHLLMFTTRKNLNNDFVLKSATYSIQVRLDFHNKATFSGRNTDFIFEKLVSTHLKVTDVDNYMAYFT
jgi:hypothetical protein